MVLGGEVGRVNTIIMGQQPGSIGGDPFSDWSPYNITSLLKDHCGSTETVSHVPNAYKTFARKCVQSILESV